MKSVEQIFKDVPKEYDRYIDLLYSFVDQVNEILVSKSMTQRDLARQLNMPDSQLSRILAGNENITLKTIARLESALGEDVVRMGKEQPVHFSFTIPHGPGLEKEYFREFFVDYKNEHKINYQKSYHIEDISGIIVSESRSIEYWTDYIAQPEEQTPEYRAVA